MHTVSRRCADADEHSDYGTCVINKSGCVTFAICLTICFFRYSLSRCDGCREHSSSPRGRNLTFAFFFSLDFPNCSHSICTSLVHLSIFINYHSPVRMQQISRREAPWDLRFSIGSYLVQDTVFEQLLVTASCQAWRSRYSSYLVISHWLNASWTNFCAGSEVTCPNAPVRSLVL